LNVLATAADEVDAAVGGAHLERGAIGDHGAGDEEVDDPPEIARNDSVELVGDVARVQPAHDAAELAGFDPPVEPQGILAITEEDLGERDGSPP
jgi:hypothetical protein